MFNHILHRQQTFTYYAEYWNNTVAYNESAGTSLNEDETKLSSFWSTPFTRLCLGMKHPANGVTNWIALNYSASSLRDVIGDGTFRPTNLSVTEWKKLLNNSGIQVKSLYVEFPSYAKSVTQSLIKSNPSPLVLEEKKRIIYKQDTFL